MTIPLERDLVLSTYEGWRAFAEASDVRPPDRLTRDELEGLSQPARVRFDADRARYHAGILVRTHQLTTAFDHLWDVLEGNMQGPDRVKGAAAIDAPPALGKSTTMNGFGREFHRRQMALHGEYLDDGDTLHIPVCHIGFAGKMTTKTLNGKIFDFYAHPAIHERRRRPTTDHQLAQAAAELAVRHGTRLFIVDDVHFLRPHTNDGAEVSNQLKWLANEYPVTFVFAGVNLNDRGILEEGYQLETAQTARRWTLVPLEPFSIATAEGDAAWRKFVRSVENKLNLVDTHQGMLVNIADYLFERSTGYIGSFMTLVTRAAARAIRTGVERIDTALLDQVLIDSAAERRRRETAAEVGAHRKRRSASRSR